jgi:natural product biosynthesis luciferase-like monooxygenase protein/amino acid adenylation domain-containing protein
MMRSNEETRAVVIEDSFPLAAMQRNLLPDSRFLQSAGVNIEQVIGCIREELDVVLLERAWQFVTDRHSILRASVRPHESHGLALTVLRNVRIQVEQEDWRGFAAQQQTAKLAAWLKSDRHRGFDLSNAPLMRLTLIRFADVDYRLVWTFHHILLDARSFTIILNEVFVAYERLRDGCEPVLKEPKPYREFVEWQQRQDLSEAEPFWRELLRGFGEPTRLELPRPLQASHEDEDTHREILVKVSAQETASLKSKCEANNITVGTFLHAAWALILNFYSGSDDVVFGAVRAGRHSTCPEADERVGLYINTIPVRVRIQHDLTARQLLAEIRRQQLAVRAHEHTPLSRIIEWSELSAAPALFESILSFQNPAWHEVLRAQGGPWVNRDFHVVNQPGVPLWLDCFGGPELTLRVGYDRTRFEDAFIERLADHLKIVLESLARDIEQRVGDISPFDDEERRQILFGWNQTEARFADDTCAHQLFEAQAESAPGALAIVAGDRQLTYAELNAQAEQLAVRLQAADVRGKIVGICLERSPELAAAILGVLKAGAAYAPLDPAYPAERLAYIISDARMPLVLTQRKLSERLPVTSARIVCLESLDADLEENQRHTVESKTSPGELAYVIYTSGSTGQPKGVAIEHRSLVNLITWHQREYQVTAADRATLIASPAFDASVWELWPYLAAGASIHVPDELTRLSGARLVNWFCAQRITLAFVPTPLAEGLFEESWPEKPALRAILTGGDKLRRRPPGRFPCRVVNHYGPTESTVVATSAVIEPCDAGGHPPPIGRPIANTKVHLLDRHRRIVPVGVPGELHIGGLGLARGYLNHPELTKAAFVRNPFSEAPGSRLYKTGDIGRYRPDGQIEFIGRNDQQIKVRGCRIELGDIESALLRHPAIKEAAVIAKADGGENELLAFIVAREAAGVDAKPLRNFLKHQVPEYMVPAAFAFLDELPITENGKLNRRALASIKCESGTEREMTPPRTPLERELVSIWCEVLGLQHIGIHDDFFELGGNSLAAVRIVSRLATSCRRELSLHDLFDSPTIAGVAEKVKAPGTKAVGSLSPTARNGHAPLSFAQERLWFLEQLSPNTAFNNIPVAFRIRGALNADALERCFEELVRRHDVFRTAFESRNGQPSARQEPLEAFAMRRLDLSAKPEDERVQIANHHIVEAANCPFDLTRPPLLRVSLLRFGSDEHLLLIVTHHIVCDGWSMDILHREVAALYDAFVSGRTPELPDPCFGYADFAEHQRHAMSKETMERDLAFWKHQLAGIPSGLELPTDRPRPPLQTYRGGMHSITISSALTERLESLARREEVTLFMLLLAAFQTLLHRYSGQTDIVVGSPVAGRNRADMEGTIGLFLNTLALRGDLSGDSEFRDLLARTRRIVLEALSHQGLPFEKLAEAIQPDRDLSRSPLFQAMFVLQNEPLRPFNLGGLNATPLHVHNGTAKFDLTLSLQQKSDGLAGYIEYNSDLFDETTISRMAGHLRVLLEGIVANTEQRVSQLPLLTEAERKQLLLDWNDTGIDFPAHQRIHELFEEQVERAPDRTAAVFGDDELTYRELNERADALAARLRALGVGPEVCVGICIERSLEMLIGLLAILKAGGAYVPLDPTYPKERLAFMLEDSRAAVLLTETHLQAEFSFESAGLKCLCIDGPDTVRFEPNVNLSTPVRADQLAYVIYTSGSTGKPKGVMVTHRNVVNFFIGMDRVLGTEPGVWLAVTGISFDISTLELLWTLTRGFKVVVYRPDENARYAASSSTSRQKPIDFSLFYFGSDAEERRENKYRMLTEGATFADANGFAAVWTPERHFHPVGGLYPDPALTSAALAMITRRLQIRAGSVVLPLHHPVRVAEDWAVVDNLSNGRAAISFASGWHANDFALAPEAYARRKEVMLQGIETVRRLWRGESVSATNGAGKPTEVRIYPKPIQSELPVWLTSSGNADTFRTAGELGLNLLTHLFGQGVGDLAKKVEIYRTAWRKSGHGANGGQISVMLHTFVCDNRAAAWEQVRGPLRDYLRTYREFSRNSNPHSPVAVTESDANVELMLDRAAEGYFQTSGLFGTPEEALQMVEKLRKLEVNELACLIDFGINTDTVLAGLHHLNRLRELANEDSRPSRPARKTPRHVTIPELILRHKVTHLQCTPSLAGTLVMSPEGNEALKRLRMLLVGGEALPLKLARQLRQTLGGDLINMYGPTETTIWSTTHRITEVGDTVPIGRPIANTEVFILDRNLQPVPTGVVGELFIGGEGVARGYLNRAELTAQKFVKVHIDVTPPSPLIGERGEAKEERALTPPHPALSPDGGEDGVPPGQRDAVYGPDARPKPEIETSNEPSRLVSSLQAVRTTGHAEAWTPNKRLYRTGDLARWRTDGTIEFLGRLDHQVKLRGHRIEPGEIESLLRQEAAVRDCVVDVRDCGEGDARLVAYVVPTRGESVVAGELRRFLEPKLPSHMIPSAFVCLEDLPLTLNGKIDRNALPSPDDSRPVLDAAYVAPRTDIERRIANLWRELLHVENVGLNDNFFDLGGHSLLVVQAQAKLREVVGINVPVVRLFQYPTIAALTDFVGDGNGTLSFQSARERGNRQRAAFNQSRQSVLVS